MPASYLRRQGGPAPGAYDAGRFSFNVAKGAVRDCQGEGLVFLPSDYAPCPTCKGARYNAQTLEIKVRDKSIADVLAMTVDGAFDFFPDDHSLPFSRSPPGGRPGIYPAGPGGQGAFRRRGSAHQVATELQRA
jgi:excinuclease ABC subunit A